MAVRSTMTDLIALCRLMINDPAGVSQQFNDQQVQDALDRGRDDIRYENLKLAPSIVNTASTNNIAAYIFADYFSNYGFWEADVVLQGYQNSAFWKVITPVAQELLLDEAHFQFQLTPFVNGTVPGQIPSIFATGKIYDVYSASASLLDFWAATLTDAYDFHSDGQSFRRSQRWQAKQKMADYYRRQAKPKAMKMTRPDVISPI
jgi:hypothetical protein